MKFTSVEICAGGGGQAIGLEQAGFHHHCLVELEPAACATLRLNRPEWNVQNIDVKQFSGKPYKGIHLLAGGVPCPPFSIAGKQLGQDDERDLFPEVIRLAAEIEPLAIMIENVRGLFDSKFAAYRSHILGQLHQLGYTGRWHLVNAAEYGVPQHRWRSILVVMKPDVFVHFNWPMPAKKYRTVGETLAPLMASNGWAGAATWADSAQGIAPTLVGGSKKHGGADLGPTRARKLWEQLGVDGRGLADHAPSPDFTGQPKLTLPMAALVQGFPQDWLFAGKKTPAYRQVGNAFPPPVAKAFGLAIYEALNKHLSHEERLKRETSPVFSGPRWAGAGQ